MVFLNPQMTIEMKDLLVTVPADYGFASCVKADVVFRIPVLVDRSTEGEYLTYAERLDLEQITPNVHLSKNTMTDENGEPFSYAIADLLRLGSPQSKKFKNDMFNGASKTLGNLMTEQDLLRTTMQYIVSRFEELAEKANEVEVGYLGYAYENDAWDHIYTTTIKENVPLTFEFKVKIEYFDARTEDVSYTQSVTCESNAYQCQNP